MADAVMKKVMETMRRRRRFLVTSHINPEGDALGSALALSFLLKRMGKQVTLANEGGIPKAFRFLPRPPVPVLSRPRNDFQAEVSMIVDVPVLSRVGSISQMIQRIPTVVAIDHHVSNQQFADVNWVDPKAAATGEMIYRLFRSFGFKPNREEALCLYVSIVTDTGSFRYLNTTATVHRIIAELVETGVSPLNVAQHLFESFAPHDLKFLGEVLRSLRHTPDQKVAWLEVPHTLLKRAEISPEMVDELVNYPRSIHTAEVAFVLRGTPDPKRFRVSFRSKGRVDVDQVARSFGGGGHIAASGCTVQGSMPEVRARVLQVVRKAVRARRDGRPSSY